MNIENAIERMKENPQHGGIDVDCPSCEGTVRVSWSGGNWQKHLDAECIGIEMGWLRWENPCGFSAEKLDSFRRLSEAEKYEIAVAAGAAKRDNQHHFWYPDDD